jgi:hypothetical protein
MVELEDQPRKIIKIKRINPSSETHDSNTTLSTLEESTLEVCKAYVEQSVQVSLLHLGS